MDEFACRDWIVEVQDHGEEHAHGLGPVDDAGYPGVLQNAGGVGKVHLGDADTVRFGQQGARVYGHDRIVVYVADPRIGDDFTRSLVDGRVRGKPGPEVEKLPNALPGGPGDSPADKLPVVAAGLHPIRRECCDLCGEIAVSGEIILPAQKKVVDAGDVWNARIDAPGAVISGHAAKSSG